MKYVGLYAKALAAAAVAGLGAYSTAIQDGSGLSASEVVGLIITVLVAAGAVWAVPNIPDGVRVYGKMFVGAIVAGLGTLGTGFTDGSLSQVEVISAVVAFIVALGLVGVTSNAASSDLVDPDTKKILPVTSETKYELYNERVVKANPTDPNPQVVLGDG